MLSVVILTYNDEIQIKNTLSCLTGFADDIVVIDSYSTDETVNICKAYGARVYQNIFTNQAKQFNWALDTINLPGKWILRMDSDEILPPEIKGEIKRRIAIEEGVSAYYLNRRMYWMGKWLKHGRMYPHNIARLFLNGSARYEEKTEEHLIVKGRIGYIKAEFYEKNLKNNLDYFTQKHLITAAGEVNELLINDPDSQIAPSLFGPKVSRTRWLKLNFYNKAPLFMRPFLYFIYRYFICLGFLDGIPGFIFHVLQGFWYRFYIDAKLYEFRITQAEELNRVNGEINEYY